MDNSQTFKFEALPLFG